MPQQTDSTLNTAAIQIKDETVLNANTPLRVGTWMKDLNDSKVNNLDLALKAAPEITKAELIALIGVSAVEKKPYKVTDSAYGIILLWGVSATDISGFAIKLGNVSPTSIYGYCGNYFIGTDVFVEQGRIPTAPTATNDLAHGFYVGQVLKTLDTGYTYICTDATNGAAVWKIDSSLTVVSFAKTLSTANLIAGGNFDFTELPAVPGAFWNAENVQYDYLHGGTDFDGGGKVLIAANGASASQFGDQAEILASTASLFGRLTTSEQILGSTTDDIRVNAKMILSITQSSSAGNGRLKIYGTARLVQP